jgi:hypothetical protein
MSAVIPAGVEFSGVTLTIIVLAMVLDDSVPSVTVQVRIPIGRIAAGQAEGDRLKGRLVVGQAGGPCQSQHAGARVVNFSNAVPIGEVQHVAGEETCADCGSAPLVPLKLNRVVGALA